MPVLSLPLRVKDELIALRRDLAAGICHHDVASRGWRAFAARWLDGLDRVDRELADLGLTGRFDDLLVEAYLVRAEVLLYADLRVRAYAALERAHELAPEDPDVLARLVRLELSGTLLERASAHLLLLRPHRHRIEDFDELEADVKEGLARGVEPDLLRSLARREAALRTSDDGPRLWAELAADWYYERLDLERARALIEVALAEDGEDPDALLLGAEVALEAGDFATCLVRARRAIARDPIEPAGALLATSALAALGRVPEAVASLGALAEAPGLPVRFTGQDLLFQASGFDHPELHRTWIALLDANRIGPDSIDYFWSPGTPPEYFDRSLRLQRIFHQVHLLDLDRAGPRPARDAGYQALLAEVPDYTLLLDSYARFLVGDGEGAAGGLGRAGELAARAVALAEAAGGTPPGFRATLDTVHRLAGARAPALHPG